MISQRKAGRQPAAYHFDFDDGPFRFSDRQKYIMLVLWVIGLSAGTIARVIPTTRQRALNYLTKSIYAGRSFMSDGERRGHLLTLFEIRYEDGVPLDGGDLDGIEWAIQPLTPAKIRPARKARTS